MNMTVNNVQRGNAKVTLGKLIMMESGTYNDAYMHPYHLNLQGNQMKNIINRIDSTGGAVTGALLAGVASDAMTPMTTAVPTNIPNGWGQRRIRFVLEVHCAYNVGSTITYYFQGYTNYPGIGYDRTIAPDMVFIINSFLGVSRSVVPTPSGLFTRDMVVESCQVLTDPYANNPMQGNTLSMRPQDVFTGMNGAYIKQGYQQINSNSIRDLRNTLTTEPIRSTRKNNMAGTFMANVIDGYSVGSEMAMFGSSNNDILAQATNLVYEVPLSENPFIRLLSDNRGELITSNFTYNDLINIDPNIQHQLHISVMGHAEKAKAAVAGQGAFWNSTTREAVVATVLSNSVPAIMMDLMICKFVQLNMTNMTIDGSVVIVMVEPKSISTALTERHLEMFKMRLQHEVLHDISHGGEEQYNIEMSVDLFGDTKITMSWAGGPVEMFVTPSFCDNLMTPVVTADRIQFDSMVHDFETLVQNVVQVTTGKSKPLALNNLV